MIFKSDSIRPGRVTDTPTVVQWGSLEPGMYSECYIVSMSVADPKLATKMWKKMNKMVKKYDAKHFKATTTKEVVVTEE